MKSPFQLDSAIIEKNARIVAAMVEEHGFDLAVVLKSRFDAPMIVAAVAAAGCSRIAFSRPPPRSEFAGRTFSLYPSAPDANSRWPTDTVFAELAIDVLSKRVAALKTQSSRRMEVMVPILTSEEREGLSHPEALAFATGLREQFGDRVHIRGLQACYGCTTENPPSDREIIDLLQLASDMRGATGDEIVVSLGGSVVLPRLSAIPRLHGTRIEIRVGEAILAGTVPGRGAMFDLLPSARLSASVIQRRTQADRTVLVVDRGRYAISGDGSAVDLEGATIMSSSSEHSVIDVPSKAVPIDLHSVDFILSYQDMLRCLDG